jgi:hypothetical protein
MFGIDDALIGAVAGPLIGGLLGGGGSSQTQATQQTLDPRMESAIYGDGGLVKGAQDWYSQNKTGLNNQMLTGMNNQWNQHGASQQGFNQMQSAGMGLMGQSVAGNPFASGYSGGTNFGSGGLLANPQQYQPAQQASGGVNPFSMPVQAAAPTPAAAPAPSAPMSDWWTQYINNTGSGT